MRDFSSVLILGFFPRDCSSELSPELLLVLPYSTYYKPMMYYKPTPLQVKVRIVTLYVVNSYISQVCIISPLSCADVRTIGLIIRTIQYI